MESDPLALNAAGSSDLAADRHLPGEPAVSMHRTPRWGERTGPFCVPMIVTARLPVRPITIACWLPDGQNGAVRRRSLLVARNKRGCEGL
jgi:hypothetical protein